MFFHFLYFWLLLHREPAVLSFQTLSPQSGRGVLGFKRCYALYACCFQGDDKRFFADNFVGCRRHELVRSHASLSLVLCLVLFLQMHRFSRVRSREPNVPSTHWNGPTLYERRDGVIRLSLECIDWREEYCCLLIEYKPGNDICEIRVFKSVKSFTSITRCWSPKLQRLRGTAQCNLCCANGV